MKARLYLFTIVALVVTASCGTSRYYSSVPSDDVYYTPSTAAVSSEANGHFYADRLEDETSTGTEDYSPMTNKYEENGYTDEGYVTDQRGNVTNNYYGDVYDYDDGYDYFYASRIRRFHRPFAGFSYYSGCYTDAYWYDPLFAGTSIYIGWGRPWYTRPFYRPWGWNNWGWNSWGWNSWGWNSPYYSYGWGGTFMYRPWGWNNWGWNSWSWNNGYWNGFYDGYNAGLWNGFYGQGYGGFASSQTGVNDFYSPTDYYYGSRAGTGTNANLGSSRSTQVQYGKNASDNGKGNSIRNNTPANTALNRNGKDVNQPKAGNNDQRAGGQQIGGTGTALQDNRHSEAVAGEKTVNSANRSLNASGSAVKPEHRSSIAGNGGADAPRQLSEGIQRNQPRTIGVSNGREEEANRVGQASVQRDLAVPAQRSRANTNLQRERIVQQNRTYERNRAQQYNRANRQASPSRDNNYSRTGSTDNSSDNRMDNRTRQPNYNYNRSTQRYDYDRNENRSQGSRSYDRSNERRTPSYNNNRSPYQRNSTPSYQRNNNRTPSYSSPRNSGGQRSSGYNRSSGSSRSSGSYQRSSSRSSSGSINRSSSGSRSSGGSFGGSRSASPSRSSGGRR